MCAGCEVLHGQCDAKGLSRRPWEVGPVARPVIWGTPGGDSEAEVPTAGICGNGSCEEIPEVSGLVSCPEVKVKSEPVGLTSITMDKGCG